MKISCLLGVLLVTVFVVPSAQAQVRKHVRKQVAEPELSITLDAARRNVIVSWNGQGALRQAPSLRGKRRTVQKGFGRRGNIYVAPIRAEQNVYDLGGSAGGPPYSANAVGYVNVTLPPGLTLLANPLLFENSTVGYWFSSVPDGSQLYKLDPEGNYEINTFTVPNGWSHPDMAIPLGTGFYFHNPSSTTPVVTFVGEVAVGELINPLPAGISVKGALVPQAGSINTLHRIPGEPGDELRMYVNDLNGGGAYVSSVYQVGEGWVPDLNLKVGEGFWIEKQNSQDWVRIFNLF